VGSVRCCLGRLVTMGMMFGICGQEGVILGHFCFKSLPYQVVEKLVHRQCSLAGTEVTNRKWFRLGL